MAVRLSVLMPVYNTARYVAAAVESILAQTMADFEFIIVDDGSTDDSLAIVEELARHDVRVRVISRPNKGLVDTRNELLREARGELIAWMDSDDIALPDRLERQLAMFDADEDLVCIGGFAQRIDPEGMPLGIEEHPTSHEEILRRQQDGSGMRFPTTVMRTDVVREVGGFRSSFPIGEDLDLFLRMGEVGKMANVPAVVLLYRMHLHSASWTFRGAWWGVRDAILDLARERRETGTDRIQRGEDFDVTQLLQQLPTEPLPPSEVHGIWAEQAMRHGHARSAFKHVLASMRSAPTSLGAWRKAIKVGQLGASSLLERGGLKSPPRAGK